MALPGILGKFFGRTVSEGAAFAAGVALGPVLHPVVREEENLVNAKYPFVPVDPGSAAGIVAENVEQIGWGTTEASFHGMDADRFAALVQEALNAPGTGELFRMWRRGAITDADFVHGLRKAKLEPRWDAGLEELKTERLDPAIVAAAIQRGIMHDPGFLPVGPPSAEGKVPAFPVSGLDPLIEAEAAGIDRERLFVETALIGNPLPPQEGAHAVFRQIIDRVDFDRLIAEGRTRNEWADAFFEVARQILTSHDYVEARLRGWIDDAAMYAGTAKHGMSREDTDLVFKISGRPLVHNQVFIGLLRGGTYDGPVNEIPQPFLKSLQESNMRPEWYNLVWAQRYHYPPFFQTINALNKGWIDAPTATEWLTIQGYAPTAIEKIVSNVAGKGPTAKKLTPTQIKEAIRAGSLTRTEGLARLEADGYSAADAALLIPVPPPATPPTVAA